MTVEGKKDFKSNNKCWICGGLFAEGDNKVRDHDHMTGKFGILYKADPRPLRKADPIPKFTAGAKD